MERAVARGNSFVFSPLPSRSRRRRSRKSMLSSWHEPKAPLPLAEQTGDASNGDGDAGLQRNRSASKPIRQK
jgi:hypothetical protein